jgi:hypothetical protein
MNLYYYKKNATENVKQRLLKKLKNKENENHCKR